MMVTKQTLTSMADASKVGCMCFCVLKSTMGVVVEEAGSNLKRNAHMIKNSHNKSIIMKISIVSEQKACHPHPQILFIQRFPDFSQIRENAEMLATRQYGRHQSAQI